MKMCERLLVVVHVCSSPRMPCTWKSTLIVLDSFFSVTVAFTQYDNENENENEIENENENENENGSNDYGVVMNDEW